MEYFPRNFCTPTSSFLYFHSYFSRVEHRQLTRYAFYFVRINRRQFLPEYIILHQNPRNSNIFWREGATKSRIIRRTETKRSANIWEEGPVYYYSATAYAYLVSPSVSSSSSSRIPPPRCRLPPRRAFLESSSWKSNCRPRERAGHRRVKRKVVD